MVKLESLTRGTTVKGILPNSSATGIVNLTEGELG